MYTLFALAFAPSWFFFQNCTARDRRTAHHTSHRTTPIQLISLPLGRLIDYEFGRHACATLIELAIVQCSDSLQLENAIMY